MSSRRTTVPWDKATAKEVADWLGMLKPPRIPAVPVTKAAANTPEWEEARDAGIGASDIGVIMGVSAFSSPYALWWQKHLHLRLEGNEAMADGHMMEAQVIREFTERHPELLITVPSPALWAHRDNPWAMCTPDRLAVMRGAPLLDGADLTAEEIAERVEAGQRANPYVVPVEAKWDASPGWGPSGSDEVPPAYHLQVMWQAWVLGAPGGWLVNHKPTGRNRYREYWIPVDEDLILRAWSHGRAFMASLDAGIAPEPDGSRATERVLQAVNADFLADEVSDVDPLLAAAWREARDNARDAAARKRELDNRLREAMGKAGIACDAATGAVIARRNVYKRSGYSVSPALIDELRMVNDGSGPAAGQLPEADGPDGDDAPAGTQGGAQAGAGAEADAPGAEPDAGTEAAGAADGEVIEFGTVEVLPEHDAGMLALIAAEEGAASARLDGETFAVDCPPIDVVTRCVPAEGIHATPHNGPCILRTTTADV